MGSLVFSRDVLIIGCVILFVILLYLFFPKGASFDDRTDFSEPVQPPGSQKPKYKDEYTDEITRATLLIEGGRIETTFSAISSVEVDETFPEVTLKMVSGKVTSLSLGAYDLLVSRGEPSICEVHDVCQIRVWSREKLVYDESLVDVELGEGYLTGYTYDGSDVCLVFGSGVTLCVEEV
jgi:hypothetical protein